MLDVVTNPVEVSIAIVLPGAYENENPFATKVPLTVKVTIDCA
jgi:hypothetical protein